MPAGDPVVQGADPVVFAARGIKKRFGDVRAVNGVDLDAKRGEVVAILGSSGSGKSTFLRCLNFLEVAEAGRVFIGGDVFDAADMRSRSSRKRLINLRQRVGMVFQSFNLWPHRTALENVIEGPMQVLRLDRRLARDNGLQLLSKVGLEHRSSHYPAQLSGGEQQRVAIARTLAMNPEVLLFDEPTSALDPELVGEVLGVMLRLADDGRTMLIVTHEMSFARDIADRVVFMSGGLVVEQGTSDEIFKNPQSASLQSFLARFAQRSS